MFFRYFCKKCETEFYRLRSNANERCISCGEFAYLDWDDDGEIKKEHGHGAHH